MVDPSAPLPPSPAVSSFPDFPTLPPVPWRPARRTARLRRRKTTTRRGRKAPSPQHGSLSTTSPWPPGTCVAPPRSTINKKSGAVRRWLKNWKRVLLFIGPWARRRQTSFCSARWLQRLVGAGVCVKLGRGSLTEESGFGENVCECWEMNEWRLVRSDRLALKPCPNRAECVSASRPVVRPDSCRDKFRRTAADTGAQVWDYEVLNEQISKRQQNIQRREINSGAYMINCQISPGTIYRNKRCFFCLFKKKKLNIVYVWHEGSTALQRASCV